MNTGNISKCLGSVLAGLLTGLLAPGIGTLASIHDAHAQEPPEVDVTFGEATVDPRTGRVTVTGTVTCTGNEGYLNVYVGQTVGRTEVVDGGWSTQASCTGSPEPFSVSFTSRNGRYAPGRASVILSLSACGDFGCNWDEEMIDTRLRPSN